jgi:hypothetical protein
LSSTDSLGGSGHGSGSGSGRGRLLAVSLEADRRVAVACFGAACAVGLVFAFVGLDTHSFWYDELFTARLLEPEPGTTLSSRIATDVHPPLYLLMLGLFTNVFGDSDGALRAFSAIAACGAIVLFIAGTRAVFSLPARLFGAAMATGSLFWFFQAQNARSYALCLLIGSAVMVIALALLQGEGRRRLLLPGLLALMLAGSFVHFYLLYLCLAVLIALALFEARFEARERLLLGAAALVLLVAAGLYVKLVIEPYSRVSLGNNWYPNDVAWYVAVLKSSLQYTFGDRGVYAILLCATVVVATRLLSRRFDLAPDRVTVFLIAVPVLVLMGGIASSTLLAPNFFDRNLLIVSPFIWALTARLYEAAVEGASLAIRLALTNALALIVLSEASIVTSRLPTGPSLPMYEPFRQSAEWIQTLPECQGQMLPVVTVDNPDWYKPGYAAFIYEGAYGRYLQGFAQPHLVFARDLDRTRLPVALAVELRQRLDGRGCPVLAWSTHSMNDEVIARIEEKLVTALGRPEAAGRIAIQPFEDGAMGYVLLRR